MLFLLKVDDDEVAVPLSLLLSLHFNGSPQLMREETSKRDMTAVERQAKLQAEADDDEVAVPLFLLEVDDDEVAVPETTSLSLRK